MGIQGLLPLLKSIHKPCSMNKFAGETVGVDAYGWLHRGTISCAIELATGKPTKKFVDFAMTRVRMLLHFNVIPYIVFDGDYLPSKAITETDRAKRRDQSKKLGLELQRAGKISQAHLELQKAIDVTPEMARLFIEELKKAGVQYVVAPYEADAQLVYLEREGIISAILSEDSDLLVFGAKCLLTKLDQYGECVEINKANFSSCTEVSLTGWSDVEFRQMAILSGCDYLKSVNGMGLKTAHRMIRKHKTIEKVVKMLLFDGKVHVPKGYLEEFRAAEKTFLHQWVFCPRNNKLVFHTEPTEPIDSTTMPFIGAYVQPDIAQRIASGDLNPITKKPIILATNMASSMATTRSFWTPRSQNVNHSASAASGGKHGVSIQDFFKPRRIPLGELHPNDFKLSSNQQDVMRRNSENSWDSMPVPESENSEIARSSPPIALPRHYLTQSQVTPCPSTHETSPSRPLSRGRSLSSALATADSRSPKRARLCDPGSTEPLPSSLSPTNFGRSPFFPSSTSNSSPSVGRLGKSRKSRKQEDVGIFSDDSVEEAFANMSDEVFDELFPKKSEEVTNKLLSKKKKGSSIVVFKDEVQEKDIPAQGSTGGKAGLQTPRYIANWEEALSSLTQSAAFIKAGEAPPTPAETPTTSLATTAIENFSFTPTPLVSKPAPRSVFFHGLATPPTHGTRTPLSTTSTGGNSISIKSLNKGIPSALQRLGARATNFAKLPATPASNSPITLAKPLAARGIPFPEVARAKHLGVLSVNAACDIPLPAIDAEEAAALSNDDIENQVRGSEDLIIHDSEEEEEEDETEQPKLNLARFAFPG